MKLYEIQYSNFCKIYTGRSRASAIRKFRFSETFDAFTEFFGKDIAEKFYEALLIDTIRNEENFIRCLGDINKNRNLAKRRKR